jgi:hypothetical protein
MALAFVACGAEIILKRHVYMFRVLFKYILGEWSFIRVSPATFALAVLAISFIISSAMSRGYEREINFLQNDLEDYRDKLQDASDYLEKTVKYTTGTKWEPLSRAEIVALTRKIAPLAHRKIQIIYANQLGQELAKTFADAFIYAGWTEVSCGEGVGLGEGVGTGPSKDALKLKSAIQEATRFKKVKSFGLDESVGPDTMYVSVGINVEAER